MAPYYLVAPGKISPALDRMIQGILSAAGIPAAIIKKNRDLPDLTEKKIVFAVQLDQIGENPGISGILSALYARGNHSLAGASAILLIASPNELYTKSYAQNLIFLTNRLGCSFLGHPLVEVTQGYRNLRTWQKALDLPLEQIALELCKRQGIRFINDKPALIEHPRILALHASSRKTSNTVMLWDEIKKYLDGYTTEELNVEKGMVLDCRGCAYTECLHYSQQNSCFYGGVVVKEIFPAIERANAIIWICPNYNDAISANLMAVINRMTALYRKKNFYHKVLFAIIVSGNSGSDAVAKQLIGALNINKGFRLPPNFSVMATANDPGDIKKTLDLEEMAKLFAQSLLKEIRV
ncbi:flavodoxin family protein [Candidatus Formimonas warabiya]|uniref:FMN reductase n=1 Tax=Formimonas warabiya TaxID=1761012 RepID=A0A3G1KMM6_FORW1|nr:NAD(P)H-dependent oxidoreductase [Candidatus Formimonas warabiya]ATW23699.1 FMN reductase [Candidatus Formimonas warabiya]